MRSTLVALVLAAASTPPSFALPPRLETFLADGKWDATPKSFRIIALSHLADGCVAQGRSLTGSATEARACVDAVLVKARALGPNRDGLFLSHLNLIYGAADALGPCAHEKEHERLSRELARRSLADPLFHAASYESTALRWPADQAVTLASLHRYDAAHGTSLLTAPLAGWTAVLETHSDAKLGLPKSELTGRGPGARFPRGCAQSYLTRYTAEFAPDLASTWWASYRSHFLVRLGPIVGFREWPPGVERTGDVDSGPILYGVGTAASAFGLSAARAQGDVALAAQLEANQTTLLAAGVGGALGSSILAQTIAFEGKWHPAPAR